MPDLQCYQRRSLGDYSRSRQLRGRARVWGEKAPSCFQVGHRKLPVVPLSETLCPSETREWEICLGASAGQASVLTLNRVVQEPPPGGQGCLELN